jgi:lysophospholipase L1-like esterase
MGRLLLPLLAAFLSLSLLWTEARAAESPTFIALGDSLAFGTGASDPASKGYVSLTVEALRNGNRYRERGLEMLNLSVPGATSSDLLLPEGQLATAIREIDERQVDAAALDNDVEIISVDVGGNDLLALAFIGSPCLANPLGESCNLYFGQVLDDLEANLTQVVTGLRQAAPQAQIVILGLYNPYSGAGGALEIAADVGVRQINEVLSGVAADSGLSAEMADPFALFAGRGRQWIADDGFHPNDKGHAVLAETILAVIEDRPAAVPPELLAVPPDAAIQPSLPDGTAGAPASGGGTDVLLLLAIVIPASAIGGAMVTGAYFLARGRR